MFLISDPEQMDSYTKKTTVQVRECFQNIKFSPVCLADSH